MEHKTDIRTMVQLLHTLCVTEAFRHGANDVYDLPTCNVALIGTQIPTFRNSLSATPSKVQQSIHSSWAASHFDNGTNRLSRNVGNLTTNYP